MTLVQLNLVKLDEGFLISFVYDYWRGDSSFIAYPEEVQ